MSTEPLGLTPPQMDQLRSELGMRRRRWPLLAVAAVAVLALGGGAGYAAGHARPRTVVRAVTRVERVATVKTVTRWRTKTVTKTATVNTGSTTPCVEQGGTVVPAAGGAAAGAPGLTTCTLQVEPDVPASDGDQLIITAPDGTSNSYPLGSPSGGTG
jgi:hypothetical protein